MTTEPAALKASAARRLTVRDFDRRQSNKLRTVAGCGSMISGLVRGMTILAELLGRNLYWRSPQVRRSRQRWNRARQPQPQACSKADLCAYLESIGVTSGALVMLHTRVTGVHIWDGGTPSEASNWETPKLLLNTVSDLLGPSGTLVMCTNAKYQTEALDGTRASADIITYDPARTPCHVGLANELFWRQKDTKRSLFPFNMLAARGPLADELLRDNLNGRKPSPHGRDSGYFRFCERNGLVISIGVPLTECLTLVNVVSEVREDWPVRDFLSERRYRVVRHGVAADWSVRVAREEFDKFCHCRRRMGRDLVAEGVIHEGTVGTLRVDSARAGEVFDFFWRKTEERPYPYYGLWLARLGARNKS